MSSSWQMVLGASACRGGVGASGTAVAPTLAPGRAASSHPAEAVDGVEVLGALLLVADAQALFGGQRQDADLALVGVVVDVVGGLPDVGHRIDLGQRGVDQPLVDQPVGL